MLLRHAPSGASREVLPGPRFPTARDGQVWAAARRGPARTITDAVMPFGTPAQADHYADAHGLHDVAVVPVHFALPPQPPASDRPG
jgi:hypothetical protein